MNMPNIEIYTTPYCPYCIRAKQLLNTKGVQFQEIDVSAAPDQKDMMMQGAKRHTVPQIFIAGQHIGGCDDLYALEASGKLNQLLA